MHYVLHCREMNKHNYLYCVRQNIQYMNFYYTEIQEVKALNYVED